MTVGLCCYRARGAQAVSAGWNRSGQQEVPGTGLSVLRMPCSGPNAEADADDMARLKIHVQRSIRLRGNTGWDQGRADIPRHLSYADIEGEV